MSFARDPDIQAARVLLLAVWRRLPPAQRTALQRARVVVGGRELAADTHQRTLDSLAAKRFIGPDALVHRSARALTPTALLVREVGLEAEAKKAKRRFDSRPLTTDRPPRGPAAPVLLEQLSLLGGESS